MIYTLERIKIGILAWRVRRFLSKFNTGISVKKGEGSFFYLILLRKISPRPYPRIKYTLHDSEDKKFLEFARICRNDCFYFHEFVATTNWKGTSAIQILLHYIVLADSLIDFLF